MGWDKGTLDKIRKRLKGWKNLMRFTSIVMLSFLELFLKNGLKGKASELFTILTIPSG